MKRQARSSWTHPRAQLSKSWPILLCGLALGLPTAWAGAVDLSKLPPAATQQGVTYEKDIRPILEKNCFGCHGERMQKAKLRLDSLETALKGSNNGAVLEKGKSANSKIVKLVARLDEDNAMPPRGNPLTKEQVGLIRAWIDQGAK
jgi:mono/diheme cytochrome c family protein